jgi:Alpha/beta hydrolase domain
MFKFMKPNIRRQALSTLAFGLALLVSAYPSAARVTKIVIDETRPFPGNAAYEEVAGRAFGELDPRLAQNAIIQDIKLGLDKDGKARYVASFLIRKPKDMSKASGMMWHEVPNRGNVYATAPEEFAFGDVMLASAWQGDNSGWTELKPTASAGGRQFLQVPVAKASGGKPIVGRVMGRIVNRSGADSQSLIIQSNPVPYKPVSLDTRKARLTARTGESMHGKVFGEVTIPSSDWAWAKCDAKNPFPGTRDATQICLKNGFENTKLYQIVFTAADPYIMGMGFAAWRDVGEFFKTAKADEQGTANPLADSIKYSIGRGVSQSGNFLRGWLHLGFNQAENGKAVHDGMWPIIAGRRISLNTRFAQPDGVLELYQLGSEGPQWWLPAKDPIRDSKGKAAGILDRCTATNTCPKILEHFGSAEVWALKLTPEWVGTDAKADLPLPDNVRRYYIASSNHNGGAGGFDTSLPGVGLPKTGVMCPGNNFGQGLLPANPVPHTQTINAIRVHFRDWVMKSTVPPNSRYPTLREGMLAVASKEGIGFPTLPMLRPTIPEADFIMPVLDYDLGAKFNYKDGSGKVSNVPPKIKHVLKMLAPKVDADGNEVGGVPVVLLDAPLGTYLGWNVTAGGDRPFHQDQICNYAGGMIPFAKTKTERLSINDPRLSLEERYGSPEGYVAAVTKATERAIKEGFLLPVDAAALIELAKQSKVLR